MADYVVSDTSLGAVADAIREKGGTSEPLEFPDGFVTAIGEISGGEEPSESYYCYTSRSITSLHRAIGIDTSRARIWLGNAENQKNRRTMALCQPLVSYNLPFKNYSNWSDSLYYPIPIPQTANRLSITCEPANVIAINTFIIAKINGSSMTQVTSGGGTLPKVVNFTADSNLVLALNFRPNPDATDFGTNEPTKVEIRFETV